MKICKNFQCGKTLFSRLAVFIVFYSILLIQPLLLNAQTSSISSNFNGTAINAGNTIWFSADVQLTGSLPSSTVNLYMVNGSLSYTINSVNYSISVPVGEITFNPGSTTPTTTYSSGQWSTNVQTSTTKTFLTGVSYTVPSGGIPGGIQNVIFSGEFLSNVSGLTVNWQWAAAVYTQFNSYSNIGIWPQNLSGYQPGTPINEKSYVTGGAMGGGGSNYTGGFSATASVSPGLVTPEPSTLIILSSALVLGSCQQVP